VTKEIMSAISTQARAGLMGSGSMPRVISGVASQVHYADEGLVAAEIGSSCVMIWNCAPDDFLFERQRSTLEKVISTHAEPIGFLCVVLAHAPPPPEPMRKASVEMLNDLKARLACVAGVIEGQGFRSAITRSVLSGMAFVLSGRDFRVKFANSVEHAADFMSQFVNIGSVELFGRVVDSYRPLLPPR